VPETEAAIRLEDAQIGPLRGGAGSAPVDAAILARFSGPGLFESCEVAGRADLLSAVKTCDLDLRVQGVSFKALLPYLDQLGLESEYEAGRFACHVTASVGPRPPDGLLGGDLAVRDLRLEDRAELFGLEGLALSGALWDPGRSTLRLNTVEVTGQRLALGRDPQGRFRVLGLRVKGPGQTPGSGASSEGRPTRPQSTSVPSAQGPARRTGRVEIGRFVWRDNEIVLEDQALSERPKVLRARFGVELNDLILDLADPNAAPGPARFQAFLQIPPLAGDIRVNGALAGQAPAGWGVDLSVVGQDLDTREVAEYLRPLGLEPRISQGDLKAEVHVDLTLRPDGLGVSAAVQDLQIRDAGQTIAGLDRLQVRDLVLGPVLDVNEVRIHGPQVLLGRDPNGALLVCGMRVAPVSGARTRKPAAQSGSTVHLNRVAVQAGKVRWIDQALAVPLDVAATVDVTVDDLTLGAGGRPARVKAQVRANPIAEQVEVSGQLFTDPQRLGADVSVDAAGLCATALGGYLPPGVAPGLDRGSLHLEVLGLMEPGPQGRRTTLQVQHLDLRETDSPDPILHVDLLRTLVARPDPNAIVVEECSVQGVEATVQRTDANEVALAGLRLGPREAHAPSSSPPVNLEPARAALQAEDTASAQRSGPATFPDVTVQSLDLQVRRVSWIDRCLAGAAPVHIEDLRVRNGSPWHLQGKSPPDSPPMDLEVAGRVAPLVDAFTVHAQATPFAEEPNLMVDLAVEGIHGSGLTLVRPDLAGRVDGSSLQAGRVGARVHAILDMPRRNPLQYDLRRPFGLHLQLSGLQVTEANDPAPLAGLSQVDLEIERADIPNRKVQVKRVEVVRPQCRLVREPGGVRLLDVLMRPAPGPAETEPHREDPAQGGSDGREPFEVTVEQLVVSGLDVACADTTVDPPVEIPLTGLDLEVQGLSTRALSEPVPIRFSAALTSGRVDLGPGRGSADAPGQDPNTQAGQTGPLFQEVTAVGRLTCGPVPTGWIKGSLGGLELRALRGLAKAHGVVLRDGVLDVGLDVRLASGQAKTRANVVLTDLSLTEPNEGPLLKLLSLPVSLDTALFLLQGPDGSIRLPLQFTITGQGVSPKEITGAAVGAAASVVAEAVAGAALRPALAVFQALGGDTQEDKRQETLELTFPAGVLEVTAQQRADLEAVADRVRRDRRMSLTVRHELGAEDMAAAEALANPPAPDRVALLGRLRSQRQAALALRNRLVEQAYVARVGGEFPDIRKATDDLAAATRQAALFDRSIDALLETLRPGTGHAAARRTREAVLLMAQTRLDIVAEILGHADRPDQTPQIQIPAPSLAVAEGLAQTRIMITMTRSRTR